MSRIIAAAELTNADAIHPGYGFLAENEDFAEVCSSVNIKFIGPTARMINQMGDKNTAKATMIAAGVPVVPGSPGLVSDPHDAVETAKKIGEMFKSKIGVTPKITIVPVGTLPRSEKKTKRVTDYRDN